jgi:hypothetical protein
MKKKYWYFYSIWVCPVCFKEKTYKERRYTKRPEIYTDRREWKDDYDYCDQ